MYRCVRIKPDGTICQNTRKLKAHRAHAYKSCVECGKAAKGHKTKPVMDFTPENWKRYWEILNGRSGGECEREAMELVFLEARHQLPNGACCRLCVEGRLGQHFKENAKQRSSKSYLYESDE